MSSTLSSRRRTGLSGVEARGNPAYKTPTVRNRGTTWAFPSFGRDPDLSAPPTTPTTPPPPTTVTPPADDDAEVVDMSTASPGSGGPSSGDVPSIGQDMAMNPEAYADTALADVLGNIDLTNPAAIGAALGFGLGGIPGALAGGLAGWGYGQMSAPPTATTEKAGREAVEQTPTAVTDGLMSGRTGAMGPPAPSAAQPMGLVTQETLAPLAAPAAEKGGPGIGGDKGATTSDDFGNVSMANDGSKGEGQSGGDKGDTSGTASNSTSESNDGGKGDPDGGAGPGGEGGMGADGSDGPGGDGDGWMQGGYTGAGDDGVVQPDQPAGTVHEGEVVIPAQQVAQHGVEPLMALAGPGAKMGGGMGLGGVQAMPGGGGMSMGMDMGGMGMMGPGPGEPPMEDVTVPPFQTEGAGEMEDDAGGYEMVSGEEEGGEYPDAEMLGPYRDVAQGDDPFRAPDQSQGATGATAMQNLARMSPDAQAAVMQVLGANPMLSSAMLELLGPSFQPLIAQALRAGAQQHQQAQMMAGGGMGGQPPAPGGPPPRPGMTA